MEYDVSEIRFLQNGAYTKLKYRSEELGEWVWDKSLLKSTKKSFLKSTKYKVFFDKAK